MYLQLINWQLINRQIHSFLRVLVFQAPDAPKFDAFVKNVEMTVSQDTGEMFNKENNGEGKKDLEYGLLAEGEKGTATCLQSSAQSIQCHNTIEYQMKYVLKNADFRRWSLTIICLTVF